MEKNEINIINDIDKENDDLMAHLGVLQQLSLGEKTNILKHIKDYNNDILANSKIKDNDLNDAFEKLKLDENNSQNKEINYINYENEKIKDIKINEKDNNKNHILNEKNNSDENNENEIENNYEKENEDIEEKNFDKEFNDINEIIENSEKFVMNFNKNILNEENNLSKEENNINKDFIDLNLNFAQNNEININKNNSDYNKIENEDNNAYNHKKEIKNKSSLDESNEDLKINSEEDEFNNNKYFKEDDIMNNINDIKNKINIVNEEKIENKKPTIKIINKESKNDDFLCDLDIFKKLQMQINKKSEILQKTIDKYNHKPKKIEIINESKLNQNNLYNNFSIEKNKINDNIKEKNDLNIKSLSGIDINETSEKMNLNTKSLLEKINKIKNNIDIKEDEKTKNKNNNKYSKTNNDKDIFIKKEIKSAQSSYEPLIFRIPSLLLDDKIEEIEIYIKLEMIYDNLKTITSKLDFISLLRQVLNNVLMLKNASFNVYMQLFNFILSLQIYEFNLSDCNPSLPCEYLKNLLDLLVNKKDLTDMIRIIIVLIKKYFPINMGIVLEQKNIVTLKVLNSYLKQLNSVILSAYINIKSIFIEINDFLFFSPPSLLSDEFPLAELYMEIYQEIRNTTDNIIKSCRSKIMKNELIDAVVFIKTKIKNASSDYIKYLDYALYKIN